MDNTNKKKNIRIILIALIIVISVAIIITIIMRANNKKQEEPNQEEEFNVPLSENINVNASPENKPSIPGNENVKIENGIKKNISEKIAKDRNFESYKLTNIKLEATASGTVLTAKISSSSTEKLSGKSILIRFYDNTGKLVSMMNAYIGQIKPGETIDFRAESTSDLANAYDMEILSK